MTVLHLRRRLPRARNESSQVAGFLRQWRGEPRDDAPADVVLHQRRSDTGNINDLGAEFPARSCLLPVRHAAFPAVLEPGVRALVLELALQHDAITYTSCEGHWYPDPDTPPDERHVGIIVTDGEAHGRFIALFERVAVTTAAELDIGPCELALAEQDLTDGAARYDTLDLYIARRPAASWAAYFAAVDGATKALLAALRAERRRAR